MYLELSLDSLMFLLRLIELIDSDLGRLMKIVENKKFCLSRNQMIILEG